MLYLLGLLHTRVRRRELLHFYIDILHKLELSHFPASICVPATASASIRRCTRSHRRTSVVVAVTFIATSTPMQASVCDLQDSVLLACVTVTLGTKLRVEASQCRGMDPACLYKSKRLCRLSSLPRPVAISMSDCCSTLSQADFSRLLQSVTKDSWSRKSSFGTQHDSYFISTDTQSPALSKTISHLPGQRYHLHILLHCRQYHSALQGFTAGMS